MRLISNSRDDLLRAHPSAMSQTYAEFASTSTPIISSSNYYDDPAGQQATIFSALPREFQVISESRVPLLQVETTAADMESDPSSFQDFMILAEFSELEGPIPLSTIPIKLHSPSLCLNTFAVHLMSTDYQVNSVGHFKISEDTQVLRKNVFRNVHVFMQYFTLYDIKARGFVRPFCFGYVSKDHVKLDHKLNMLINEFDKMTKVLKQANRIWFAGELEQYLGKLRTAKDKFIQSRIQTRERQEGNHGDQDQDCKENEMFSFDPDTQSRDSQEEDPDAISLEQIAHQYLEIENMLKTVKSYDNPELIQELENLATFLDLYFQHSSSSFDLSMVIRRVEIELHGVQKSIDALNIPLVHPLKSKGESLRPLTTLGQVGTLHLVWKLLTLHKEHHTDLVFSIMRELSLDFEGHCGHLREQRKKVKAAAKGAIVVPHRANFSQDTSFSSNELSPQKGKEQDDPAPKSGFTSKEEESLVNCFLRNPEVDLILDKIHTNCPVPPSSTADNKSGSYRTVSEQDLDAVIPSPEMGNPDHIDQDNHNQNPGTSSESSNTRPPRHSIGSQQSQSSSDPEGSIISSATVITPLSKNISFPSQSPPCYSSSSVEETIVRKSWYEYAEGSLARGTPGYGILRFFRHYPKVAHHILYSILIGRPIVICGSEDQRSKISRHLTALIPFIPPVHGHVSSWKLLRWHRGVLVSSHIQEYKLIGLCIPERLIVHDLIHPRDQNAVTIFNISFKKAVLLGPAYSGKLLAVFEGDAQIQRNFHNSDLSFLTFLGGILTEIQTKLYMLKSLQEKDKNKKQINYKQLHLKASDIEIVRYLSTLVSNPDQVLKIF